MTIMFFSIQKCNMLIICIKFLPNLESSVTTRISFLLILFSSFPSFLYSMRFIPLIVSSIQEFTAYSLCEQKFSISKR